VINDITVGLPDFQTLISTGSQALKVIDANLDKVIYSRLVELLVPILINKASNTKYCIVINLPSATTLHQAYINSNLKQLLVGFTN
jgi:hypothetical protein